MRPDEAALRQHLTGGPFLLGMAEGRWREPEFAWPHLTLEVAAPARPGGPAFYTVRFDLSGYPQQAPLATFWDPTTGAVLADDRWPTGTPNSRPPAVFRPDWARGHGGFYAAFDRSAITTHPDWRTLHAAEAWTPQRTLTDYLEFIHGLLASPDHTGPRSPWPPALL